MNLIRITDPLETVDGRPAKFLAELPDGRIAFAHLFAGVWRTTSFDPQTVGEHIRNVQMQTRMWVDHSCGTAGRVVSTRQLTNGQFGVALDGPFQGSIVQYMEGRDESPFKENGIVIWGRANKGGKSDHFNVRLLSEGDSIEIGKTVAA